MAVIVLRILGNAPSGEVILTGYDTDTTLINIYKRVFSSPTDTTPEYQPYTLPPGFSPAGNARAIRYSNCEGSNLARFVPSDSFPYVEKRLEPNAQQCIVSVCDLAVQLPVGVAGESIAGAGDGSAVVTATSSHQPIEYSLDNVNFSAENRFTGLTAGTYTVYLRDANNCLAQATFRIDAAVGYGLRYHFSFSSILGETYRVDLSQRGFTGTAIELECVSGDPVQITTGSGSDSRYKPIRGSECQIGLLARKDFQFTDLFTSDEKEYFLQVLLQNPDTLDFSLFWKGYLLPDQYREPYTPPPYPVYLSATDGLGILKNAPFANPDGTKLTSRQSVLSLIHFCLGKTDYRLPYQTAVKTYELQMPQGPDDDPLVMTEANPEAYYDNENGEPMDCYAVLEGLLTPFGARIYQSEGYWRIEQVEYREQQQRWVGAAHTCLTDAQGNNTGEASFSTLILLDEAGNDTGISKPNDPQDPDYAPNAIRPDLCLVSGIIYYSRGVGKTLSRTNCQPGESPSSAEYYIPQGAFSSNVSQQAANDLAIAYIDTYAQQEVNGERPITNYPHLPNENQVGVCAAATSAYIRVARNIFSNAGDTVTIHDTSGSQPNITGTMEQLGGAPLSDGGEYYSIPAGVTVIISFESVDTGSFAQNRIELRSSQGIFCSGAKNRTGGSRITFIPTGGVFYTFLVVGGNICP